MARSATLKRKSSDVDCGNNVSEEDMQRFNCGPKEDFVRLSPEAMEERVRKFLKEAYENLRNWKFVVIEEESESEGKLPSFSTQCTYKYIYIDLFI